MLETRTGDGNPSPSAPDLTLLQRLGLALHRGCCSRKKSPGRSTIIGRSCSPCLAKTSRVEEKGETPEEPRRSWGHPVFCHSPAALCPSSLSLNPTWTITNLSLRFELCHLPASSSPPRHRGPSPSLLSPALVGQRRSPSAARPSPCVPGRIQPGFQESGLAVPDSCCLGWHPLLLVSSAPIHPSPKAPTALWDPALLRGSHCLCPAWGEGFSCLHKADGKTRPNKIRD